jgi:hypothetical protein
VKIGKKIALQHRMLPFIFTGVFLKEKCRLSFFFNLSANNVYPEGSKD